MRVFICGIDGYLGWTLAIHLANRGHTVSGIDNGNRRKWLLECGSGSAIPIVDFWERQAALRKISKNSELDIYYGDLLDFKSLKQRIKNFKPDTIVHLAENPSAPYSMIDREHCLYTMENNLFGTLNLLYIMKEFCPEAHLLKLGTMGEYGTPNLPIAEGFFEVEFEGHKDRIPFPKQAGSWYHQTKVHDSNDIAFACRIWNLRSTDIMQGVVYGTRIPIMVGNNTYRTRFDFDAIFGTAINRFVASTVIDEPMTLYGLGGQKRGFLPLKDSMQCFTIAIENPPAMGEYRVFNQFEEVYSITELAGFVRDVGIDMGLRPIIKHVENPRMEAEKHFYKPKNQKLLDLGYVPTSNMKNELAEMFSDLIPHGNRLDIYRHHLLPDIRWSGERKVVKFLED